jgi:UDP-N-acetylglucosamine 2-epimerase (non-hydrolysing)
MPEEINRILVDHCSNLLFAPTKLAAQNLRNEGIPSRSIYRPGDTMMDAFVHWKKSIDSSRILDQLGLEDESYVVLTTHRVENVDDPQRLNQILSAATRIGTLTVFPVHPRTKRNLGRFGFWSKISRFVNIRPITPLDYIDMLRLVKSSRLLLTDSGGMQKEAFMLRVPCLTLRDRTEWVETVTLGANKLVGACKPKILREAKRILASKNEKRRLAKLKNPYGDGRAAERMVSTLLRVLK